MGAGIVLIGAFFLVKMFTKVGGVFPFTSFFGFGRRRGLYTTLLMATGLTFGTISALFGLTHGYINQAQYTVLVTVVILSAVAPTVIAERFFRPENEPAPQAVTAAPVAGVPAMESEG
jgi:Kef-type K+ transport system membrane component KefB